MEGIMHVVVPVSSANEGSYLPDQVVLQDRIVTKVVVGRVLVCLRVVEDFIAIDGPLAGDPSSELLVEERLLR